MNRFRFIKCALTDFNIKGSLIEEKIKVKASFLNLAKESPHMMSPIPKRNFLHSGDSENEIAWNLASQVYGPLKGQRASLLLVWNYEGPSRCRQNMSQCFMRKFQGGIATRIFFLWVFCRQAWCFWKCERVIYQYEKNPFFSLVSL